MKYKVIAVLEKGSITAENCSDAVPFTTEVFSNKSVVKTQFGYF